MTEIIELQVGYHANKTIPYQRIICNTDFTNPKFEINNNGEVAYTETCPKHWVPEVEQVCKNIDTILQVAKLNQEANQMIATISSEDFTTIHTGNDVDIWKDIKVWNNGTYPTHKKSKLEYIKHSYTNKYLRRGISEIKMVTETIYHNGHELHFQIDSSTWQNRYTVNIMGTHRLTRELTDGIHGDYHGYRYFKSFEEVQNWFNKEYGVTLVKNGDTKYHRY